MDWTSLVVQIPVVAAFIWFSLQQQKQFQEYNEKAASRYQESMDKRDSRYLEVLDEISKQLYAHDSRVDERIAAIAKATAPVPAKKKSE